MRVCRGEQIAENKTEFLAMLGTPNAVQERYKKNARPKPKYIDVTATFDIETTNTETDGFAYSFQTCIGGAVVVPVTLRTGPISWKRWSINGALPNESA